MIIIISIQIVIFLSLWQTVSIYPNTTTSEPSMCVYLRNQQILVSLLTSSGVTTTSEKVQAPDMNWHPEQCSFIEIALFKVMHIGLYD